MIISAFFRAITVQFAESLIWNSVLYWFLEKKLTDNQVVIVEKINLFQMSSVRLWSVGRYRIFP